MGYSMPLTAVHKLLPVITAGMLQDECHGSQDAAPCLSPKALQDWLLIPFLQIVSCKGAKWRGHATASNSTLAFIIWHEGSLYPTASQCAGRALQDVLVLLTCLHSSCVQWASGVPLAQEGLTVFNSARGCQASGRPWAREDRHCIALAAHAVCMRRLCVTTALIVALSDACRMSSHLSLACMHCPSPGQTKNNSRLSSPLRLRCFYVCTCWSGGCPGMSALRIG